MIYPNHERNSVLGRLCGTLPVLASGGTSNIRLMPDRVAAVIAGRMPPEKSPSGPFTNRAADHMQRAVETFFCISTKDFRGRQQS